jgi:DNA-binding SARP family transcriptional activator/DNA-binding XRE family transcriptional regulator
VLLGGLVRDRRQACGLTQRELASRSGLSLGTVRDLEQGRTRRPHGSSLTALAAVLGLSVEHISELGAGARAGHAVVRVLGPVAVSLDGMPVPMGRAGRRVVLGLLALSADSVVDRETLIDVLWPDDPPANAVNLVQAHVSRLRRLLAPGHAPADRDELLVSSGTGYRLQAGPGQLDLLDFQQLTADAQAACWRGDEEGACGLYRQALGLWRGEPLSDVELLRGHPAVAGLSRRWAEVVLEYAQVACGAGWHEQVLGSLRELAGREPLNEQAHAQLMIALAGCGQQAEALAVYQDLCGRLAEELGIVPGLDLAAAHQRVLCQDIPSLRADQAAVTVATADASAAPPASAAAASAGRLVVPRQLPAAPECFVGRAAQLSALDSLLEATAGTVTISAIGGTAGVGKTALALHWAHRAAARFPDGQLYVNLRGYDPSSAPVAPAQVLDWFLGALGAAAEGRPASLEARTGLYRSLVAGKRLLIVLDNARDTSQVRPLLPGSAGCLVLVTSRARLSGLAVTDGARLLSLDVLTEAEARHRGPALSGRLPRSAAKHLPCARNLATAWLRDHLEAVEMRAKLALKA